MVDMALATTAQVVGDKRKFRLSPNVKRYTLMDTGFKKTNKGGFELERSLDLNSPFTSNTKLKVLVNADLDQLSMSVTTANGLRAVDIFKSDKTAGNVEQFNYVINDLVQRQVLEPVTD
ncbi:hypothetical protein FD19_GL000223 [Lacticaseibacillus thailandensis DSM 22698 = JCM 13996]|uniref:Cysteine desulfurase n=2 Tax=Lacticaseibacillus thailandensis TaxID=381741 RepID=A0A0R2C8P7_9LACO|nr:hypothetical protein FD19_GL000223 [Lacticaseibacillus thailandensis DSM 22698 = JCM 13996]